MTVVGVNQKNQFEVICKQKTFQEINEKSVFRYFGKGLMVFSDQIIKFEKDYSKISAQTANEALNFSKVFEYDAKWLVCINFYYPKLDIFDINTLTLRARVTNLDFDQSKTIFNFSPVESKGVFYFYIDNMASEEQFIHRVQVINLD